MEAQEEQRLARGQREYLDLEIRKFRRKKLLIFHSLEQELLREVRITVDMLNNFFFYRTIIYFLQNLFHVIFLYFEHYELTTLPLMLLF